MLALTWLDCVNLTSLGHKNHNPDTQGPTRCNIRFHLYEVPDVVKLRDRSRRVLAGSGAAAEGWGGDGVKGLEQAAPEQSIGWGWLSWCSVMPSAFPRPPYVPGLGALHCCRDNSWAASCLKPHRYFPLTATEVRSLRWVSLGVDQGVGRATLSEGSRGLLPASPSFLEAQVSLPLRLHCRPRLHATGLLSVSDFPALSFQGHL